MTDDKEYKIIVRSLSGVILTYTVSSYTQEGSFVSFTDRKSGQTLKYAYSNCEIKEVF